MMFLRISNIFSTNLMPKIKEVKQFSVNAIKSCSTTSTAMEKVNYFQFSEQETRQILHEVNSKSISDLKRYDISKAKLNKIHMWKLRNGKFNNLDEILHLDGFSVKVVEKFCISVLGEEPIQRTTRKKYSFVTPSLSDAQITKIKSSVSVNVSFSTIAWSRLELNNEGPCNMTHWQTHGLKEQKLNLHELIHRTLYVAYLIPQADCYLFESPQVAQGSVPGNADQVNINVQRAQLIAMLGFALASRNESIDKTKSNVFFLKRFLAARLFQNLIGTERVSAEKSVLNLMDACNMHDVEEDVSDTVRLARLGNIAFSDHQRDMYNCAEGYQREFLGQTLLLNLAFVRLVLLRDAVSIALLSRTSKQTEA